MKQLDLRSALLRETTRYPAGFTLPDLPRDEKGDFDREKARNILLSEEYGVVADEGITHTVSMGKTKENCVAGKCARYCRWTFTFSKNGDAAGFPADLYLPAVPLAGRPLVVALDFPADPTRNYFPMEEVLARGVALARVQYDLVTSDDGDFTNGLARLLVPDRSDPQAAGKLAIWAWAAAAVARELVGQGIAQSDTLWISGHSRLGKTALLAAALDPVFAGVHSNNSGCSGMAISREKTGETVAQITRTFPYWFAPRYASYADREREMPFDQHFLAALVAPRRLSVSAAEQDTWADTEAQFLCAEAASVAWREQGAVGLDPACGLPRVGERSLNGRLAFQTRPGTHYFSLDDWRFLLDFIDLSCKNA